MSTRVTNIRMVLIGEGAMDLKSIISYQTAEYGSIKVKLGEIMDQRGITRNRLRTLTGIKYDVIDRYYKGQNVSLADLDFLAKCCYVLDCSISDLLEYQAPENTEPPDSV